jgi:hypothetical protein
MSLYLWRLLKEQLNKRQLGSRRSQDEGGAWPPAEEALTAYPKSLPRKARLTRGDGFGS